MCGVSVRTDLIRADRKGMKYHYVDAYGIAMTSMVELGCPTFLGDVPGAVGEAKQRIRKLDSEMETAQARLDRLEADNQYLRAKLEEKVTIDVTGFVQWLGEIKAMAEAASLPMAPVNVGGLPYEVPVPVANMIIDVAAVPVSNGSDDDDT